MDLSDVAIKKKKKGFSLHNPHEVVDSSGSIKSPAQY